MNDYQRSLYQNLMALCGPHQEAFYYVDQSMGSDLYRIFLYRLASFTEFQQPGALECRGHTFRIDADGNALELESMPMQKFFNLGENPFVMGLDLSTIEHIADKLDGSLISTVIGPAYGSFFLKSKGSFYSEQARAALRLLETPEYEPLKEVCLFYTLNGCTVNMEYMAPDNRIVVGYAKPTLKILNVRDHTDGKYIDMDRVRSKLDSRFIVDSHPLPEDGHAWTESVYKMTDDIEGFVVRLSCGTWFKLKTEKYCALHKTKDSITIPRRLFESCVTGGADDLRGMFASDALAISQINAMEEKVAKIYNHIHKTIHAFYNENKGLERKEYAIKGQATKEIMDAGIFGLVMNLYVGKEANVEEFMIKHYKDYGIKDETEVVPEME